MSRADLESLLEMVGGFSVCHHCSFLVFVYILPSESRVLSQLMKLIPPDHHDCHGLGQARCLHYHSCFKGRPSPRIISFELQNHEIMGRGRQKTVDRYRGRRGQTKPPEPEEHPQKAVLTRERHRSSHSPVQASPG